MLPNPKSNNGKPRRRKNNSRKGRVNTPVSLAPCTIAYAKAKLDPFDYMGSELPCVPDILDLPSQKLSTLVRAEIIVGTTGMGFALVAPNPNSSDAISLLSSTSLWASDTLPTVTGATGTVSSADTRFPYPSASSRQGRIVACGVRVRYTGTELNMGGQVCMSVINGPDAGFGGLTKSQVLSEPSSDIRAVSRKWIQTSWNPAYPDAFAYDSSTFGMTAGGVSNGRILVMVTGEPGNTYQIEIVRYYELVSSGTNQVTNISRSHADPVGFGFVKDFLASEPVSFIGRAAYDKFLSLAKSGALAAATSYVAPGFVPSSTLRLTL